MGYKTILAVLDTEDDAVRVSDFAATLAAKNSGHVIGLHVEALAAVPLVAPMEIPDPATIQTLQDMAQKETQGLEATFRERFARDAISHEWRSFVSSVGYDCAAAIDSARSADIVIAAQKDPQTMGGSNSEAESFLFESGRPVLIVPYILREPKPFRKILVAWNGSREATRAVFDALPFLTEAESVEIFSVDPPETSTQTPETAGATLARTLARHGVNVTIFSQETDGISAYAAIENRLSDNSIDLLVMGAYGRSRLWEALFGGVTRTLLESMTAVTLLSR